MGVTTSSGDQAHDRFAIASPALEPALGLTFCLIGSVAVQIECRVERAGWASAGWAGVWAPRTAHGAVLRWEEPQPITLWLPTMPCWEVS
jgi:hypothetical protein